MKIQIKDGNPNTLKFFNDEGVEIVGLVVESMYISAMPGKLRASLVCHVDDIDVEILPADVSVKLHE